MTKSRGIMARGPLLRFLDKVDIQPGPGMTGCWQWTGAKTGAGYGNTFSGSAHRFAYKLVFGAIIEETLDHLCRNRSCVNPLHLEPTSRAENYRRGMSPTAINGRKTHCDRGHELGAPDNTFPRDRRLSRRRCKKCAARKQREKRHAG